ncbi:MAG: hypothetical protein ACK2TV_14725 [Anaerolineales bacterium]
MFDSQIYSLIVILTLVALAGLFIFFRVSRKESKPLTPLMGLGIGCVIAGIVFGEERWLGYGLMGIGVTLSVIDTIINLKEGY